MLDFSAQGWPQVLALLIALALCSLIGLERELRQKSAGLRTHTLVGLGAALFMVVSKYGFGDVIRDDDIMLDPSRLAAQIVSGIGFIGAGVIFVRQDMVRGLTTAATIWVAAAVGTAAGAGLWLVASVVTAAHFLVAFGYAKALQWLTRSEPSTALLHVHYEHRRGMLRSVLSQITDRHFTVQDVDTRRANNTIVHLSLRVRGKGDPDELMAPLLETDGVQSVLVERDGDD